MEVDANEWHGFSPDGWTKIVAARLARGQSSAYACILIRKLYMLVIEVKGRWR
jgi:hypothetical protein